MHQRSLRLLPILAALAACGPKPATTPPAAQPAAAEPVAEAPKAAPIPDGWFAITPQISVPDVDAAAQFYTTAFGAEKVFAMPGPDGKTMHAEIKIGDSIIMIDAENEGVKAPTTLGGTPAELMVYVADVDAAFQQAVDAGATVKQPVEEQFWGDRYGVVTDPSGHRWGLATHVEDLTDEQMMQRAELAMPAPAKGKAKYKKPRKGQPPAWKKIAGTPATQPVPANYHTVTLALTVDNAAAAIDFYKAAFGATEVGRMPMPDGRLAHAEVKIGDSVLMLSDAMPEMGTKSPKDLGGAPLMIHHYTTDVDGVFAKAAAAGGKAAMPVGDMFWGDRYGAVIGPDGFGWGVATHVEDVPQEQMAERMKAAMQAEGAGTEPAAAPPATDAAADPAAPAKPPGTGSTGKPVKG